MYFDQAMREPDSAQFKAATTKEVDDHETRGHWKVIDRTAVPHGMRVLPSVWSMKRKRRVDTGEIYKWKARLNVHGGKQEYGVNYWETYAPMVNWSSIRLFLTVAMLNGWHSKQIDFVLAYPQADAECDLYMEAPKGFTHKFGRSKVLKLLKNIYGQRQAGRVFYLFLRKGLVDMGFQVSEIDECVFYRGDVILMAFVDNQIALSPNQASLDQLMIDLEARFDVTDEGELNDYLGVHINKRDDGTMELTQPKLTQQILDDLRLTNENTKSVPTPAVAPDSLGRCLDDPPFDQHYDYRSIVGKLLFLERCTRPDLAFSVHSCARFSSNPRESHGKAIKRIGRYLHGTHDKGLIYRPCEQSFECWADADFAGLFDPATAEWDEDTARSRSGYIITYAGCPLIWSSKLQTTISMSSTEAEYVCLSEALRSVIPMMELLKEAQACGFNAIGGTPTIHCRAFEDNSGALELANNHKFRPRTKHLNVKYHHFRSYVRRSLITVSKVASANMVADILTKPLSEAVFCPLRDILMGWSTVAAPWAQDVPLDPAPRFADPSRPGTSTAPSTKDPISPVVGTSRVKLPSHSSHTLGASPDT
jgi:histone deacetylase 1/2